MPKISFGFSGYCNGVEVSEVSETATGNKVDVSQMDAETLIKNLNEGLWCLSLGDYLYEGRKNEIEMVDFEAD